MKNKALSDIMFTNTKWDELFDNELELIGAMMLCESNNRGPYKNVKGYIYISSFKKYIANNAYLTDKQMVQLKRLAKEIYIHLKQRNII